MIQLVQIILCCFCLAFTQVNALNVLLVKRFKYVPSSATLFVQKIMPALKKHGINFVTKNPDLVVIAGRVSKSLCEKYKDFPVVIFDEIETASLDPSVRACLKEPNVCAVYKNTVLRDKAFYNQQTVRVNGLGNYSYHFNILNNQFNMLKKVEPIELSNRELEKIVCCVWDPFRSFLRADLQELCRCQGVLESKREIDVFFAGNMWSRNTITMPGRHRRCALSEVEQIKGINALTFEGRISKIKYWEYLKRSKIVISPWGFAEWCWRDYEAVLAGAVVIKPNSDFVLADPDLYRDGHCYVACKSDFSDLEEKVRLVLSNYEKFTGMRLRALKLLQGNWSFEKCARKLALSLNETYCKCRAQ